MAIGATIHTFETQLADVDRSVYESFTLRVARHPSETVEYMTTRVLAYCLEFADGIAFASGGVSSTDEPAVLMRDLTGAIVGWVEVGQPDAARLHHASKLSDRVAVYTHRDPAKLLASWQGKTIYRADQIRVRSFDPHFIDSVAERLGRRNDLAVSVTEGMLFIEVDGVSLNTEIHEHQIT